MSLFTKHQGFYTMTITMSVTEKNKIRRGLRLPKKMTVWKGRGLALLAVVLVGIVGVGSWATIQRAQAISDVGPDQSISSSKPKYVLINSPNTGGMRGVQVPIYSPTAPTGPVSVTITDFVCKGGSASCIGSGDRDQYVEVGLNRFSGATIGTYNATTTISIPASAFTLNSLTGHYRAVLYLQLRNGNNANVPSSYYGNGILFRIKAPGYYIGSSIGDGTSTGSNNVNYSAESPVGGRSPYTYEVPFATPCSIETAVRQTIRLYDVDSGGLDNEGHTIGVSVINADTGATVATSNTGSLGDLGTYDMTMTFAPEGRYILRLTNVSAINYIRFRLPYDDINSVLTCADQYGITPIINIDKTKVDQGGSINTMPSATSSGAPGTHDWRVSVAVFTPGAPRTFVAPTNDNVCAGFGGTPACTADFSTGRSLFKSPNTRLAEKIYSVASSVPSGSYVCFVTSVKQPNPTAEWGYSGMACAQVVPPPDTASVQIWGNDFYAGGYAMGLLRSPRGNNPNFYGSWTEYGILSTGENTNIASAAGLHPGASSLQSDWSSLTFANNGIPSSCSGARYGCWGPIPDTTAMVAALKARAGRCDTADKTIGGMPNVNDVQYICTSGTVRITGDITYANTPVGAPARLPQVIIIAKDIIISNNVKNVDAWLIATSNAATGGRIATCDLVGDFPAFSSLGLREGTCPNPLTINGPIIAKKLFLYRTTKLTEADEAAETLNLRADAFLWASAGGGNAGDVAETVSVRELPPRF